MKSIVEPLDDNRVKLTVEVPEAEIEAEVDEAFKRLAHQVRMPGFRPGRAPRKLLEAQLGPGAGRSEALRTSVHKYYDLAVIEHDVDVIDLPEIEIIDGQESGSMSFGAVVEVRPRVAIAGYEGLRIEVPNPAIDDAEIEEQVDRFRRTFAELVSVGRPAADGDHVTIDITGTVGAETIAGLTASDYDYVVGTGAVVAEIDENLRGAAVRRHPRVRGRTSRTRRGPPPSVQGVGQRGVRDRAARSRRRAGGGPHRARHGGRVPGPR